MPARTRNRKMTTPTTMPPIAPGEIRLWLFVDVSFEAAEEVDGEGTLFDDTETRHVRRYQ